ncbi:ribose-phosphate diphosphokinase [Novosphingobium flavum]|uniref:Ribose-phosphate diphosphokinase n=1 Tax=Novosphingobium aerophilum TaxID=2839843 RepID=A0A7X1F5Q2_9SPHN|nr:ribose-phosphate diphosphokinase [Novosphingobium aerophilum]MBC2650896.1 ribose-phosphate diphosphokinase [Novosphingobium aerophilum]MBC2663633.1 ribose-phosphate diphosphokinase [Novosphingobium aerophilum]
MTAALFAFTEQRQAAERLGRLCRLPVKPVEARRFPDGESLVRVEAQARTALLYASLDHPNPRIVELLLAASALRDQGCERVMLIAPYLAYMRQDMAFHPGEAVSQRVIGRLLAGWFDGVMTVDPHLHRIARLDEVIRGIPAISLSAAPVLAAAIGKAPDPRTILVGPDSESRPWVESMAHPLGLDVLIGEKVRKGDRDVVLRVPGLAAVEGRPVVLVDDLISSGTTLLACAQLLREAGATSIEALATHVLAADADLDRLAAGGISRIRATDSVASRVASIALAPVLGQAVRDAGWLA